MTTVVHIDRDRFYVNGRPTYEGREYDGLPVEGLLFNARLVQGLFDDVNEETRSRWAYPDTAEWDPERNVREFLAQMATWRPHGLLGFTLNLQGGNPVRGTGPGGPVPIEQPWHVSAYREDGSLLPDWLDRLTRVLDEADRLGMVVILGLFYFGQDHRLRDEKAVRTAAENVLGWLADQGRRNVIVEVANECNVPRYSHDLLTPSGIVPFIRELRASTRTEVPLSASYAGFPEDAVPSEELLEVVDLALLHGNLIHDPEVFVRVIRETRDNLRGRPMPLVFNEDNHFDFDARDSHLRLALENYASWGYFDPGAAGNYHDGYQCPPVNWASTTQRKQDFFRTIGQITADTGAPAAQLAEQVHG
ncbi:hypothetical protein DLE60_27715 [Micromonospora globispora]|uniref:hypothetical protein n=1 Tax=Micromonospora globispora TaxID=1450148 RepID=UPI000D6F8A03|nr:hypothetical protein [Micromonospora globispora]PWU55398.1 hypothetical protein DLE60_27715 [Micromonospora globispora]RQW91797.1 hypothetical protein DKL51_20085 [Micromonospora globispora]